MLTQEPTGKPKATERHLARKPKGNRSERRRNRRITIYLNRAITRFTKEVFARSPNLRGTPKSTPVKDIQKKFVNRAKKLVKKDTMKVPAVMIRNGMHYGSK